MSPLGSRASRAYSPVSMASGFGDRARSQEPLEEEPAAKIALRVLSPAAPASTAASGPCSASPRWSGRQSGCRHGAASRPWDAGVTAPARHRDAAPGAVRSTQPPRSSMYSIAACPLLDFCGADRVKAATTGTELCPQVLTEVMWLGRDPLGNSTPGGARDAVRIRPHAERIEESSRSEDHATPPGAIVARQESRPRHRPGR